MTKICIRNVAVFDSEGILKSENVVFTRSAGNVQNYMADGSDAETSDFVVDGRGCSLIPGLIDVCVNIKGANAALGTFASYGVTTVVDMSSSTQQCRAMRVYAASKMGLSTFFTCGTEAVAARDYQPQLYNGSEGSVIRTREDALAFVSAKASGPNCADFINVAVNLHSFDDEILKAIVDAARADDKLTIARTSGIQSYRRALHADFDIFVHAPLDAPIDEILARKMAGKNKIFVPTLIMMRRLASNIDSRDTTATSAWTQSRPDRSNLDPRSIENLNPGATAGSTYENAMKSVRTLHDAGVAICAGTAANLVPGSQIPFGESLHEELHLLVEAGMPALDVLRSATCVAAKAFRLGDRGMVREGLRADLLLVEGNPLENISVTRNIKRIWIRGEEVNLFNAAHAVEAV
ncbi:hypothetical protein BDP55DRAFT_564999 [Colletotrichum godetiae]|uniref:Amidohydrolase-related domain-containing protein n=1 Tax=Colletotrichum godetiae TaxID=1209918 RepID=A0AAJ0A8L3_9PEZI|nr:uncharacterized protein BDP55DRAFT_564999 [Colletotrichum godetiae]KAK1658528.1 hypothetical protein BDP55DRAFT_564999 [Colletotrichum godetiae]